MNGEKGIKRARNRDWGHLTERRQYWEGRDIRGAGYYLNLMKEGDKGLK